MRELKKDTADRALGRRPHICRICGTEGNFESYLAREMMQNKRDEFEYFVCERCKCLQIAAVPENLGDYYGSGYYSFAVPENPDMEFEIPVSHMEKILDVGCGSGAWLVQKAASGWGNLYGCDPFLDHDRHFGSRVRIRSCSIHDMEGEDTFDGIRMGDSFEHMTDPYETLVSASRLLKSGGVLIMRIPTYPNVAFDMFGPHWYQLDAPRHIFLHSRESLDFLAQKSGLALVRMEYDSNELQVIRSFFYQRGIPFYEITGELINEYFDEEARLRLKADAIRCNKNGYGDHMKVWWQKKPSAYSDKSPL